MKSVLNSKGQVDVKKLKYYDDSSLGLYSYREHHRAVLGERLHRLPLHVCVVMHLTDKSGSANVHSAFDVDKV